VQRLRTQPGGSVCRGSVTFLDSSSSSGPQPGSTAYHHPRQLHRSRRCIRRGGSTASFHRGEKPRPWRRQNGFVPQISPSLANTFGGILRIGRCKVATLGASRAIILGGLDRQSGRAFGPTDGGNSRQSSPTGDGSRRHTTPARPPMVSTQSQLRSWSQHGRRGAVRLGA